MSFLRSKRPYWEKPSVFEAPDLDHPQLHGCVAWYPLLEGANVNLRDVIHGAYDTNYFISSFVRWEGTAQGKGLRFDVGRADLWNSRLLTLPTTGHWHVVIDCRPTGKFASAALCSYDGTDDIILYSIDSSDEIRVFWRDVFLTATGSVPDFEDQRAVIAFGSESHTRHVLSFNGDTVVERTQSSANAGPFSTFSIGNWLSSNQPYRGYIFQVRFYNRFLRNHELKDICHRPWAPYERARFLPVSVVTGPVQLDIDDLDHVRPVDAVDLVEITVDIDIDGLDHARPVDAPMLGPIYGFFVGTLDHARPVDGILITPTEEVAPANLTHGRVVDQVDVTEVVGVALVVESLTHVRPVDPLLLDVEALITVEGLDHARPVDTANVQPLLGDQTGMGATGSAWVLDAGQALTNAASLDFSYHVLEGIFDGSNSVLGIDGARVTGPAGMREITTLTFGADVDGNRRVQGEIAELRIYAGALSASDRDTILSELTTKWITG